VRGRRAAPLVLILAGAATAAPAQDTVSLRLLPPVGQVTSYHTELAAWLESPMLPPPDSATPTVTLSWDMRRLIEAADTSGVTWLDVVDSSSLDMPAVRGGIPQLGLTSDILRGLRMRTRVTRTGGEIATEIVEAPALPPELPLLLRGVVSLAVTSSRLSTFAVPDRPVRPGESWTDSVRYELPRQPERASSIVAGGGVGVGTFCFERLDRRGAGRVAIVRAAATIDAAALETTAPATMRFTGTGRVELDLDGARLASSQLTLAGTMVTRYGAVPTRLRLVRRVR
jgi:hypothetical protein